MLAVVRQKSRLAEVKTLIEIILVGTVGFLSALSLAVVYSALILAHRTDDLIERMSDETIQGGKSLRSA